MNAPPPPVPRPSPKGYHSVVEELSVALECAEAERAAAYALLRECQKALTYLQQLAWEMALVLKDGARSFYQDKEPWLRWPEPDYAKGLLRRIEALCLAKDKEA